MRTNPNRSIPGSDVRLGDRGRDQVTGFTGVVTTYSRHLSGCDDVWLQGASTGDEQKARGVWCHVQRLELVDADAVECDPLPPDVPAAG